MGTSGLFEPWRIVEVGAVAWFYAGDGGAYDYWPEGLGGPIDHDDDGTWTIRDGTTVVATHPDADVRISVLWKAGPAVVPADPPPLRPEQIVAIIDADGRAARPGITTSTPSTTTDGCATSTTPTTPTSPGTTP